MMQTTIRAGAIDPTSERRLPEAGVRPPGRSQRPPGNRSAGFTVLVVDDEQDIREAVSLFLETCLPEVKCLTAPDGPSALDTLRNADVDLIVTDYRMPGMNGLDMLGQVQDVSPGTPAVMMTAFCDPALARRAQDECRVLAFFGKPLDLDTFLECVSNLRSTE